MKRTIDRIVDHQLLWAERHGIQHEESYTRTPEDHLFGGELHAETRREFERGKGQELAGHMRALHSSSALVVNVFDYWRRTDRAEDIAHCLGAQGRVESLDFEKTHRIAGVRGIPPHLDLEFGAVPTLALESKFTETYRRTTRRPLSSTNLTKYLKASTLWDDLPNTRALAERIVEQSNARTSFEYLDVPQIVKHILGLYCCYQGQFCLLYLWYRIDSPEATRHEGELKEFEEAIDEEISFRAMTYQELFERIRQVPQTDSSYLSFLEQRYFSLS